MDSARGKVDLTTGLLRPENPNCNAEEHRDHLPFQECTQELLRGAAESQFWRTRTTRGGGAIEGYSWLTFLRRSRGFALSQSASDFGDRSRSRGSIEGREAQDGEGHKMETEVATSRGPADTLLWISHFTTCNLGTIRLAKALNDAGIPLAVLGLGTFWKARWGYRMRVLHDFLLGLPEDLLVVNSDGEDVVPVPLASSAAIISRYQDLVEQYNGPRVFFPAEVGCWPRTDLSDSYPNPQNFSGSKGETPFKYLNAGVMIGPVGLIRKLLAIMYRDDCSDDQLQYTFAFLDPLMWWEDSITGEKYVFSKGQAKNHSVPSGALPLVGLDYWNHLMIAMFNRTTAEFNLTEGAEGVQYNPTGGKPLILHQNGSKRKTCVLDTLCRRFGYAYRVQCEG